MKSRTPFGPSIRNAKSASDRDRGQWQDGAVMRTSDLCLLRAGIPSARLILGLLAALVWPALPAQAAVTLTQSDVVLEVFTTAGSLLSASQLSGLFGAHRCVCPENLVADLQLTSAGQTDLGSSTVSVNFLLGANCFTSPASCISLGQVSFSQTQSAQGPTFSSTQVFQAAEGSTAANCASLVAASTTLWAVIAQDGTALSFAPSINLPVVTTTVGAPTAVTALASNQGLLVTWTPPTDASLVAGYQVLCLPRPTVAATAGYESCGFDGVSTGGTIMTPADATELCYAEVSASTTQVRLSGLVNGTPYTVAVVAIDPSGGVSALSPPATATPEPTLGFYEKYKQDGGSATGCALSPSSPLSNHARLLWIALAASLLAARYRSGRRRKNSPHTIIIALMIFLTSDAASAQIVSERSTDDWARNPSASSIEMPPDWGLELGISLYRPAVDSEFGGAIHPYADTFGSSRHLMSEVELDRYLGHQFGSWGVGLRIGYQKVTGTAFFSDGITPSGDETSLRLVPFSLSALYKADGLPGLRVVPLVPYVKAGLDGVYWTETTTGGQASHNGFTPGWHVAAGIALGLNSLGTGAIKQGAVAGPGSLFFEWDYAAINGLGMGSQLHVGDSTWCAGLMFDL
jgi:hypothetical protein